MTNSNANDKKDVPIKPKTPLAPTATIRRGANEIGGSAVELKATSGERIILDLGLPLDAEENTVSLLPDIRGLKRKTKNLLAILISHPHQDHYALGKHIDKKIPVYMGMETKQLMDVCVAHHLPNAFNFENIITFANKKPFTVGSFKITPYLMDHSAYGSYSFLIEVDGKRLFYSGDFRAHGRKGKLFDTLINNPPQNIDTLLMEGSCLGRNQEEKYETETSLENKFFEVFNNTKGVCLVQTSSQNIDRIVTVFKAAKKAHRNLVISGYTGHILMALNNPHIPNFTWKEVKKFTLTKKRPHHITPELIEKNPNRYVILPDYKIFNRLKETSLLNATASFIYSMWNGYKELYQDRLDYLTEKNIPQTDIHTSGHADIPTLKAFASAINPKRLVPMHTFYPKRFKELFENVVIYDDNEDFEI